VSQEPIGPLPSEQRTVSGHVANESRAGLDTPVPEHRCQSHLCTQRPIAKVSTFYLSGHLSGLCKKPASLAVALKCGIGSSSLNAEVKAFDRLHIVRG